MYLGQGEQAHEAADKIALVCDLFSRYSGLPSPSKPATS